MNSKEDLCKLIEESPLTLIGYTFQDEKKKDELISNFNYVEIKEIDSSFSFKSFLRNEKLNHILDGRPSDYIGKNFDYILLDLNSIRPTYDGVSKWDKSSFIRNVLEKLRERIWVEDETQYKIIITSPVNKSINTDEIGSFIGGNTPIFMSDLVIVLKEYIAKVIKNRNGRQGNFLLYNVKQTVEI